MAFRKLASPRTSEETLEVKRQWYRRTYEPKPPAPAPVSVGEVYGRLTVTAVEPTTGGRYRIVVRCSCSTETIFQASQIKKGKVKSCGCYRREYRHASYFHGTRQVSL